MSWNYQKFLPRSRMGIFTLFLVLLWLAKTLFLSSTALSAGQRVSLDLFTLLLAVPGVYYAWKLFQVVRRRLLWKIRRRLILAHIFIGAIPFLLVTVILYVSALLVYYQLSYYLILNQTGIHSAQVHALNVALRSGIEQRLGTSQVSAGGLQAVLDREVKYVLANYPSASIIVRALPGPGENVQLAARNVRQDSLQGYRIPRWIEDREFIGLVVEDTDPELYRNPDRPPMERNRGRLFIRSLVFSDYRSDCPFSVELSIPFDTYLLERLKTALGQDLLLADHIAPSSLNVMLQTTEILQRNILSTTFNLEEEPQVLGRPLWSVLLFPVSWSSGGEEDRSDTEVLFVEISTTKLIQNVFRPESDVSRTIVALLRVVVGFFVGVELLSIILGILLTKSITSAVYNLDRGTEFIKRGDFSHRIVVRSDDQLSTLARSFNQMTEYIQSLVRERVQRERLERELEIAKEVQEQLFPRRAPKLGKMDLTGLCLPARVVSGDYYDFLQFSSQTVGIALGDICGKGISAALLMANLQATLRSNVLSRTREGTLVNLPARGGVASTVKMLNEQVYQFTSANKFASFFYAVYDDEIPVLTYCNAGHNPPLYFSNGQCQRLTTGGTVVGIFPDAEYEQSELLLHPGDLFVAYTDGIVESVNEYGEEFGEHRLVGLIERNQSRTAEEIQQSIVEDVLAWSFEEERDDDMTLIVGKVH